MNPYILWGICPIVYLLVGFVVICLVESSDGVDLAGGEGPIGFVFFLGVFILIWPLLGILFGFFSLMDNLKEGYDKLQKKFNRIEIRFKKDPE